MKFLNKQRGFTLIELLVVIAIIGILSSVVIMSISDSRAKGADSARKIELQEILKAMELYYHDNGAYPNDDNQLDGKTFDDAIRSQFDTYLKRLPEDVDKYHYCASADLKSMMIAVDTVDDKGGSAYCSVTRGTGTACAAWMLTNAFSPCAGRF